MSRREVTLEFKRPVAGPNQTTDREPLRLEHAPDLTPTAFVQYRAVPTITTAGSATLFQPVELSDAILKLHALF